MGILMFLLSVTIIAVHSESILGIKFLGPEIAVQSFFVIFGFHMSLVLNEKYVGKLNKYRYYIANRVLRIYPIYFITLIATAVILNVFKISSVIGNYVDNFNKIGLWSHLLVTITNITIIGQDLLLFLGVDMKTGSLFFTSNFRETAPWLVSFLFIPQAWALSLMFVFYLIAPFIVKRKTMIILLITILCLIARLLFHNFICKNDPWSYRFFPLELFFFTLGALSYKLYLWIKKHNFKKRSIKDFFIFFIVFSLALPYLSISKDIMGWIYYIFLFLFIPFIFLFSNDKKFDRNIRAYAFPLYISHMLAIMLSKFFLNEINLMNSKVFLGELSIFLSIIFSFILIKLIIQPVERIKKRINS